MTRIVACRAGDLPPGQRRIVDVEGRSIGLFNVDGRLYAVRNLCPHRRGPLCQGPLTGTALPADGFSFVYGHEGRILRCAWHGWEFEIETGRSLVDPRVRARTYPVTVEDGQVVITL